MRALLIAFPAHVARETVTFLTEEIEAHDPNALHLEGFVLSEHMLTIEALPRSSRPFAGSDQLKTARKVCTYGTPT